jgi:hypothetical protein
MGGAVVRVQRWRFVQQCPSFVAVSVAFCLISGAAVCWTLVAPHLHRREKEVGSRLKRRLKCSGFQEPAQAQLPLYLVSLGPLNPTVVMPTTK